MRRAALSDISYVVDVGCTSTLFHDALRDFAVDLTPVRKSFSTGNGHMIQANDESTVNFKALYCHGQEVFLNLRGSFADIHNTECLIH